MYVFPVLYNTFCFFFLNIHYYELLLLSNFLLRFSKVKVMKLHLDIDINTIILYL